jgi:ribokinase
MILVFGSLNVDFVTAVARLPVAGETALGSDYQLHPGGKGANQALAAARSGADVALFGAVGQDQLAQEALALLGPAGINTAGVVTCPGPTGAAFIAVDAAGANQIVVAAGANAKATADKLIVHPVCDKDILLLQYEVPEAEAIRAARHVKQQGGKVILNTAPAGPISPQMLANLDILIMNEHEAAVVVQSLDPHLDLLDPVELVRHCERLTQKACIVTLGSAGAIGLWDGVERRIPAPPVTVVDTTAAGDAFVGAFAAALAKGYGFTGALQRGVAAGSLACTRVGAQPSLPFSTQIEALVAGSFV